jgi:hypothetical protein
MNNDLWERELQWAPAAPCVLWISLDNPHRVS